MKIVTCAQMHQLEERAVAAGVPLDTLMESAGLAVARRIVRLLDGVRGKRVVVLNIGKVPDVTVAEAPVLLEGLVFSNCYCLRRHCLKQLVAASHCKN